MYMYVCIPYTIRSLPIPLKSQYGFPVFPMVVPRFSRGFHGIFSRLVGPGAPRAEVALGPAALLGLGGLP